MSQVKPDEAGAEAQSPIGGAAEAARDAVGRTVASAGTMAADALDDATGGLREVRRTLEDAARGLPSAPFSTRLAWRAGRWLGRAEGVLWLASKGIGVWWHRTKARRRRRPPNDVVRVAAQWGPSVVATGYLSAQLWRRIRRSDAR